METNIVFVISSAIFCSTNPLSYSLVRSVFSPAERAEQTVRTLESIRSKVPRAKVLLIEAGREHAPDEIRMLTDAYLYIGNRRLVREATDGPHKGYGEAVGLILANRSIQALSPGYCFKLSGRYYLNEDFQPEQWLRHGFTARMGPGWMSTTLYGFSYTHYEPWRRTLKASIPFLKQGEAIENTMWRLLPRVPEVNSIESLGVSGVISPWGGQEVSL